MNQVPAFKMLTRLSALIAGFVLSISSCAPIITKHRMAISHETIPCPDSIRTTCMLVKIDTMDEWQPWPMAKPIFDFDYQLGYSYDLAVEEVQKRNKKTPPWWRLVEVMSKEEYTRKTPRVVGTKWTLREYGPSQEMVPVPEGVFVTLNFADYGSISGNSGCNRFFAEASFPDSDRISVSNPGSTRMMCSEPEGIMEVEREFLSILQDAQSYHMQREVLTILCERDHRLIFDQVLE